MTFGGTTIGTFTGGTGTTALVVTLNASATPAAAQALVRNVTYRNVSENPSTATRTARFVLTDGDGGTSAPATREITVTAVNDAPVARRDRAGSLAYTENDGPEAITPTLTVTDADSPNIAERDRADHRQLRQRPGRAAAVGAAVRRHAELQPGDRHADADGRDDARQLPDDPARGDLREHQRRALDARRAR